MSPDSRLAGIILAAGQSRRMGREKALLPWREDTLLSAGVAALSGLCDQVLVVCGPHNADALAAAIAAAGARLILNPDPACGQLSSLQCGLTAALAAGASSVAWTPVDCPPLSRASLAQLAAALHPSGWAVVPERNGQRGHPVFAGPALIAALVAAPPAASARDILHSHAGGIVAVTLDDPLVGQDCDTPAQYAFLGNLPIGPR